MRNGIGIDEQAQKIVETAARNALDKLANGTECVEIKCFFEYGKPNVTVFIWKREGIALDDCEAVHNLISDELDRYEDKFPDEYVLNVSSSGLDRKIVSKDDFRRALDTEIEIVNTDKKKQHGVLVAFDEESITVNKGGNNPQNIKFLRKNITAVQPYIRF